MDNFTLSIKAMGDNNSQMSHPVKGQKQNVSDDEMGRPPFFIRLKSPPKKKDMLEKIPLKEDNEESHNSGTSTSIESLKKYSSIETKNTVNEKNVTSINAIRENFIMWENSSNLCWLDASLALLAHNQTLRLQIDSCPSSQVYKIIKSYFAANREMNDFSYEKSVELRIKNARDKLKTVQESSLNYLQPRMKCKEGEPDSAFCSMYNLIVENKTIRSLFDVEFSWIKDCENCKNHRSIQYKKPIITLAKVKFFCPDKPVSICQCTVCKEPDQKMTLLYKKLPTCLTFHFENGAGHGKFQCLDFELNSRNYELTGVMVLEKCQELQVSHFVTWIRDPASNCWLECNDLNPDVKKFTLIAPELKLEDIYIITFEAVDKSGIITESSDAVSCSQVKGSETCNAEIPLIDLCDEAGEKSENQSTSLGNSNLNKSNKCSIDKSNSERLIGKQDNLCVKVDNCDIQITDNLSSKKAGIVNETNSVLDRNLDQRNTEATLKSVRSGIIKQSVTPEKDSNIKSPLRMKANEKEKLDENYENQNTAIGNSNLNNSGKCDMDKSSSERLITKLDLSNLTTTSKASKTVVNDPALLEIDDTEPNTECVELTMGKTLHSLSKSNFLKYDKIAPNDSYVKFYNQEIQIPENFGRDIGKDHLPAKVDKNCDIQITDTLRNEETGTVNETNTEFTLKNLRSKVIKRKVTPKKNSNTKSPLKMKSNEVEKPSDVDVDQKDGSKSNSANTHIDNKEKMRNGEKETVKGAMVSEESYREPKSKTSAKNLRIMSVKQKTISGNKLGENTKTLKLNQISNNGILGKRKITGEIAVKVKNANHVNDCSSTKTESSKTEAVKNNQLNDNEIVIVKETIVKKHLCENLKNLNRMSTGGTQSGKKVAKISELSHSDLGKVESQIDIYVTRKKITPKTQVCEIAKSLPNSAKNNGLSNTIKQNANESLAVKGPRYSNRKSSTVPCATTVQSPVQSCSKETEEFMVNSELKQITRKAETCNDEIIFIEKTTKRKIYAGTNNLEKLDSGLLHAEENKPTGSAEKKKKSCIGIPLNITTRSMKESTKPSLGPDLSKRLENSCTSTEKTCEPPIAAVAHSSCESAKSDFENMDSKKFKNAKGKKIKDMLPEAKEGTEKAGEPGESKMTTIMNKLREIELKHVKTKKEEKGAASNQNDKNADEETEIDEALFNKFFGSESYQSNRGDREETLNIVVDYMFANFYSFLKGEK